MSESEAAARAHDRAKTLSDEDLQRTASALADFARSGVGVSRYSADYCNQLIHEALDRGLKLT